MYTIGIDLGGTNIKAGLCDREGKLLKKMSLPTNREATADSITDAMAKLSVVYPRIVRLEYTHFRHIVLEGITDNTTEETMSPFGLFASFFASQNACELNEKENRYLETLFTGWEERR